MFDLLLFSFLTVLDIIAAIAIMTLSLQPYIRRLSVWFRIGLVLCMGGLLSQGIVNLLYILYLDTLTMRMAGYWIGIDNLKDVGLIIIALFYVNDALKYKSKLEVFNNERAKRNIKCRKCIDERRNLERREEDLAI